MAANKPPPLRALNSCFVLPLRDIRTRCYANLSLCLPQEMSPGPAESYDNLSYVSYLVATVWRGPAAGQSGDSAKLVPPSRWDVDRGWGGEGMSKRFGSFVQGAELFDDSFFALSTQEVRSFCIGTTKCDSVLNWCSCICMLQASAMDAQQRVLLEACWEALGHSIHNHNGARDAARAVGVAVGISYNEYYLNSIHQVCPSVITVLILLYHFNVLSTFMRCVAGHDGLHCDKWNFVGGQWPYILHLWTKGAKEHVISFFSAKMLYTAKTLYLASNLLMCRVQV